VKCCDIQAITERMIDEPGISKGFDFKIDLMQLEVDRYDDENIKFMAYEMKELDPGYMFRFRITGINRMGNGPPSIPSFSGSTNPGEPCLPARPFIAK
jgi:hypothetical protein